MEVNNEPEAQDLINGSIENGAILSEDALRQLSKSLTRLIPSNVDSLQDGAFARIRSMLQDVLYTASSTKLSLIHGAAALNALCGFLEQCSTSSIHQIRRLSYDTEIWTRAFNIYLRRSNNNKPKPLRRLLLTLTRLLSEHPTRTEKVLLVGISCCIATRAIRRQDDLADIKPAIQALEHFLRIGLISAAEVARVEQPEELGLSRTELMKTDSQNPDTQQEQVNQSVQRFAFSVLEWMQYPDCSPAVGRFLPVFFKSLEESQKDDTVQIPKEGFIPLWISPVKQNLERHQELWEVFEFHILPGLLRLGPVDFKAFLKNLPFENIQRGDIGSSSDTDIQLCLLVAKIAAEDLTLRNHFGQEQSTLPDLKILGINLLEHSCSSVRIAALSVLISSSTSTRPFCRRVLRRVRQCIPYFHVEVNAKPRNEFIALMKKLCMRLRGATLSLLRDGQDPDNLTREQASTAGRSVATSDDEGLVSSRIAIEQALDEESHILEEHLAFRKWYMVFLLQELRPSSSYQSHITALKILDFLMEQTIALRNTSSKNCKDYFDALKEDLPRGMFLRPLTELLLDPFDDVRQSASRIFNLHISLNSIPRIREEMDLEADSIDREDRYSIDNEDEYQKANLLILSDLSKAENRAATMGRADHADGLGRLYNLLFTTSSTLADPDKWHQSRYLIVDHLIATLEKEVNVAKDDLLFAVSNIPLHGHLIALRYIVGRTDYAKCLDASLENWKGFDRRISSICFGVWEVVHDILCSDAPEGHDVSEDEFNEHDIGTKDTLSFCWRALKESSLLMHAIITNTGYIPEPICERTDYEGYHILGYQAFTQLAELRHRGAFSTASHTFAACCLMCARSSQHREFPKQWYKLALKSIKDNASSLTRRSAGIPAIITGILAAYPGDIFFDDVVVDLQAMANAPVGPDLGSLPQVHALNCLKDIFTDARFGLSTEVYVADALDIAASCLESHIWNIRNCGLMLFKALLKRLNGGTDTSSTKVSSAYRRFSQLTYKKYPNLPDLLLRLLRRDPIQVQVTGEILHPTMHAHRVFPALEVIERFGIPSKYQGTFFDALLYYNESSDWSIREKAAKALSLIVDETALIEEVASLLEPGWKTQNALHGRLLRLRFLLARNENPLFGEVLDNYEVIASILEDSFETLVTRNACPITAATFLNTLADLFAILFVSNSEKIESFLVPVLAIQPKSIAKDSALTLQKNPLRRCMTLANYVQGIKDRPQRNRSADTLRHFSKTDRDAVQFVNSALQNMSDENDLAVLRFCSARELRWASDITQCLDTSVKTVLKNNRQYDYTLALHGYAIGERYPVDTTEIEIQGWIRRLSEALAEGSDLRTRTAAVFSIRAFFDALLDRDSQLIPHSQLLGVYLALYDSLIDDDEDVRDQGARVVSTILPVMMSPATDRGTITLSLSPPAAKKRLLHFLSEGYRNSMLLCIESVRRLIGRNSALGSASADMPGKYDLHLCPVAHLSLEAQTTSTVVFVEERQNLYIDSVSEAEDWAELLLRLDPEAWPLSLTSELETWTVEGLSHIHNFLQNSIDGALSPTSKPEVFTLFSRVLLAAKVLIMRHGSPVSLKGKVKEQSCFGLLEKLLDLGRSRLLHDLLIYRIETVLLEIGSGI